MPTLTDTSGDALYFAMRDALGRHGVPWTGTAYRAVPPRWAGRHDLTTGRGSFLAGGRFNTAGSFPVVYASTTPELALTESLAFQRRARMPEAGALPLLVRALRVSVRRMLDLSAPQVLARLNLPRSWLAEDHWWLHRACGRESLSQRVGRAAHDAGAEALLVPSARAICAGMNIVVFINGSARPARLRALRSSPAG